MSPRLGHYVWKHRGRLLWGSLMLVCTTATGMVMPQLFRVLVDAIEYGQTDLLDNIALMMIALALAAAGFRVLSRVHIFNTARNIEYELRSAFYAHLLRLPPAFFEKQATGDLMSRATNDLLQVRLLLGPGLLNIVNTALIYAVGLPLLWMLSPKLTLISTGVLLPSLWLVARLSQMLFLYNRDQQERLGKMSDFIQENLSGAHVVRAFGITEAQNRGFDRFNRGYYKASVKLSVMRSFLWRLITLFAGGGTLAVFVVGAQDVMAGRLSLGDLVAVVEYLALLAWPNFALGWVLTLWQRGKAGMARLDEILDVPPHDADDPCTAQFDSPDTPSVAPLRPRLSLRHLSVQRGERQVLDDISVEVAEGQTLGIVGSIGSGKSSLLKALLREVEVPTGSVFVGDEDACKVPLAQLRKTFGVVHQTPILFSKNVAANVAFADPDCLPEEFNRAPADSSAGKGLDIAPQALQAALENASFMRDLDLLPQGLWTPIGEKGVTLSGGQKQRLAIARALMVDPPILVLDDALSAVDSETESEILRNIKALRQGRTTLIVAHRISSVRDADKIIVLDDGKIVESGDHQSLVAAGGFYASLARRQENEEDLAAFSSALEDQAEAQGA